MSPLKTKGKSSACLTRHGFDAPNGQLGGEEFGIYLPRANGGIAACVAERIRAAVEATIFVPTKGRRHALIVSVGCAVGDGTGDFGSLFRLADERLYAAKKNGRNRVRCAEQPAGGAEPDRLRFAV